MQTSTHGGGGVSKGNPGRTMESFLFMKIFLFLKVNVLGFPQILLFIWIIILWRISLFRFTHTTIQNFRLFIKHQTKYCFLI